MSSRLFRLDKPLKPAVLIRRYKRFLADVRLPNGKRLTVHCPNSGSMKACCEPGRPVLISDSGNPKRKLRFTWEMIQMGRTWVGVHSAYSNRIVEHFIDAGAILELEGYEKIRAEVKYGREGRSRADLLLEGEGRPPCYVEVKHSTMKVGWDAAFPDAVTERGKKHLIDLRDEVRAGNRAVLFFLVGRNDCRRWRPAVEIDPAYAETLREVMGEGVEVLVYRARFGPEGVALTRPLAIDP